MATVSRAAPPPHPGAVALPPPAVRQVGPVAEVGLCSDADVARADDEREWERQGSEPLGGGGVGRSTGVRPKGKDPCVPLGGRARMARCRVTSPVPIVLHI